MTLPRRSLAFNKATEGQESIDGLDDLVDGLEENIGVDVGVLAVVRIGYKNTRHQREILCGLRDQGFSVPVVIGERGSLIEETAV